MRRLHTAAPHQNRARVNGPAPLRRTVLVAGYGGKTRRPAPKKTAGPLPPGWKLGFGIKPFNPRRLGKGNKIRRKASDSLWLPRFCLWPTFAFTRRSGINMIQDWLRPAAS